MGKAFELSTLMRITDLVTDLRQRRISPPIRRVLEILFDALGIELRFCKLEWCQWPFVPKKDDHHYCKREHADEDWNKKRRVECAE